ncbi:MAG TPA: sugar ABC transporter permease [Anaerolineales bacterium]|nr:sugar ABC transporter permease [Anaerolineales bacterium]
MPLFRRIQPLYFIAPYLLGALILIVLPAGLSFLFAFARYNAVDPPVFTGRQNFQLLRQDPLFWTALQNSLLFILIAVPLRLLGALGLALLYSRPRRANKLYRAAVYVPTIIPDTAYALTWLWILNPYYGPLNASLRTLGLPAPNWLADSSWAPLAIILVTLFQIGEGFVILLAALRHIPGEIYDAARVDGANRRQIFDAITLPLLNPWLVLLSVRDVALSFQNTFTPAYIMTRGGPYYSTFYMPLFIYETAFDGMRFGQAAALTLIVFLLTLILVLIVYFVFEGWEFDEN